MPDHILAATLGTTWAVVPEAYGFFTGLYPDQPAPPAAPPEEVWIVTTQSAWSAAREPLGEWARHVGTQPHPFIRPDDDLASAADVRAMRELIFRVVLRASENCRELSCSLAGGRKTMSADMQEAARTFGCARLLHVLSDGNPAQWPQALREPTPNLFTRPLPENLRPWIFPVILPGSARDDLLDVHWQGRPPIRAGRFPTGNVAEGSTLVPLIEEIEARRQDSGLLTNFIAAVEQDERHENWRSLYRLPPRLIETLRATRLQPEHRELLRSLPKAELHCHIGGILDLPRQRRVAEAIWETLSVTERTEALEAIRTIDWRTAPPSWPAALKQGDRAARVAAVFQHFDDAQIGALLFPPEIERTALKTRHPLGFSAYEMPGELSGSAVLGHPAALEPSVAGILEYCRVEGVRYLELRGSPHKYRPNDPVAWLRELADQIRRRAEEDVVVRFIWIADRRQPGRLPPLVAAAARARREIGTFLVGLDLAGDESSQAPADLAPHFLPAFEACLPLTIHAGEGERAQNIWEAAYHLHADRIGHGLSLAEHPELLRRFRDRSICLELCPTSNREVVGYVDPAFPDSRDCSHYPLRALWDAGVPLTLCTDNPGISRTTPADEYLAVSRMTGGLTLWDALAMMKQGFVHAFADARTRERNMKDNDPIIYAKVRDFLNR